MTGITAWLLSTGYDENLIFSIELVRRHVPVLDRRVFTRLQNMEGAEYRIWGSWEFLHGKDARRFCIPIPETKPRAYLMLERQDLEIKDQMLHIESTGNDEDHPARWITIAHITHIGGYIDIIWSYTENFSLSRNGKDLD